MIWFWGVGYGLCDEVRGGEREILLLSEAEVDGGKKANGNVKLKDFAFMRQIIA